MAHFVTLVIPQSWQMLAGPIGIRESDIADLTTTGHLIVGLMLLSILAGAAVSAIQFLKEEYQFRLLVGVCGLVTAGVSTINGTIFSFSPKEALDRLSRAHAVMKKVETYISIHELPPSGNERDAHIAKVTLYLDAVDQVLLGGSPPGFDKLASAEFLPSSPAYAAEMGPEGFADFPKNDDYIYFIGTAKSNDLEVARSDSLRLAKVEVERSLLDELSASSVSDDSAQAAKLLAESGIVADTGFHKDADVYTYSTLYAIRKRSVVDLSGSFPAGFDAAMADLQKKAAYFDARWRSVAASLDAAREHLSWQDYAIVLNGRNARRERRHQRCIDILAPAVKKGDVGWYLGWFNLGLAYWDLNKFTEADEALAEAAALEPKLPVRDPSIYNSYGQFLVRTKKYQAGKVMLSKALSINPELSGAKYQLKIAEQKMASGTSD